MFMLSPEVIAGWPGTQDACRDGPGFKLKI
jgi:hypothetical protein